MATTTYLIYTPPPPWLTYLLIGNHAYLPIFFLCVSKLPPCVGGMGGSVRRMCPKQGSEVRSESLVPRLRPRTSQPDSPHMPPRKLCVLWFGTFIIFVIQWYHLDLFSTKEYHLVPKSTIWYQRVPFSTKEYHLVPKKQVQKTLTGVF